MLDGFERALAELAGATLTMLYGAGEPLAGVRARIECSAALREKF